MPSQERLVQQPANLRQPSPDEGLVVVTSPRTQKCHSFDPEPVRRRLLIDHRPKLVGSTTEHASISYSPVGSYEEPPTCRFPVRDAWDPERRSDICDRYSAGATVVLITQWFLPLARE